MKKRINGLLTLLIVLVTQITFAQDMNISGVVSDSNGMPVAGANVKVKGTTTGTQSDFDGGYKIKAKSSDVLVFSFQGMNTQELKVSGVKMNARLSGQATELEGVVVTALGIKRDVKSLGYASQKLSSEQVNTVPTGNFVNNLAGKVAGLNIIQGTNFAGSTSVILRGYKSILSSNEALFVVDGVPIINNNINSNAQRGGGGGFDYGNSASDINPNDIADVNVLKGAAATALYGSRAQNGAIIITTKKGKFNSDLSVEFSSSLTTSNVDKSTFPTYQQEYGEGYDQSFPATQYLGGNTTNFRDDASYGPRYDNSLIWQYGAFIPGSPTFGQQTKYKIADNGPITFFKTGISTVNNITLSAGNEKASFRFNYGNTNANDILPNSYLNKNNFTGTSSYKFTDKLSATFNVNYVIQYTKGRNSTGYNDNILANFRQWWPTNVDLKEQEQLYNISNQNYTWNIRGAGDIRPLYWDNPYFQRNQNYEEDTRKRLAANVSLNYDVNKHINLVARIGTDGYTMKTEERRAAGSVPANIGLQTNAQPSAYYLSLYDINEQNYDFLATFKTDIVKDLNLNLIVGTNLNSQKTYINRESTSGGLFIPGLYTISNSLSAPSLPVITDTRKDIFGAFTQASLGYKGTLYLEGSYRKDISTTLPINNNRYDYYSASTSFVFTNLGDLKNSKFLTFGKLRAAYAKVGSDTGANLLLNTYNPGTPFTSALYSYNTTAKNPNLRPQQLKNKELGINLQFAKNRVGIDVAWFENEAFDQILALPISLATGSINQNQNAGTLSTKGYEISLNLTPIKTNNFSWDLNLNWSNPKTKVTELAPGVQNILLQSFQGGVSVNAPLNSDYGTIWGSTYVNDANGNHIVVNDPTAANNGSYLVSTTVNNELGSTQAQWRAGLNNKFTYKNVSVSFLIDWKKGGQVFSLDQYYGYGTGLYPDSVGNNDLGNPLRDPVTTGSNSGGVILPGVMPNPTYTPTNGQQEFLTNNIRLDRSQSSQNIGSDLPTAAFVYDASFVKLREAAFTYTLPAKFFMNKNIKGASFSLIGNNLWIIDKKLPFADPEAGLSSGNVQGYQSGPMPTTRNISFNVKINF